MLILAITGMPGAGKTTASQALETMGLKRIAMGDMIREETKRRGLHPDDKNMGMVMRDVREKYGPGAVAELCLQRIEPMKNEKVMVVDGVRSAVEVDVFKRAGEVKLLAIHASRERRFALLTKRKRTDDPLDIKSFDARDDRELSIGIGGAIALADEVISNEHLTREELGKAAITLATRWIGSVGK
ncbi:MAG: AAA family ATPase [Thaumarchaeota archaeon]|nr:AAA family ATPase [Nitrososphaerota archaeon]